MSGRTAALLALVGGLWPAGAEEQPARPLLVDHVFIAVAPGATEERAALAAAGLTVRGTVARHEGAGTASVGVLFTNAYLEPLWLDPTVAVEAGRDAEVARTRRRADWRARRASPFGIGLRPAPGAPATLPLPSREHTAAWMRPGTAILVLSETEEAPAFFVVPAYLGLDAWVDDLRKREPAVFVHGAGLERLTRVVVKGPDAASPPVQTIVGLVAGLRARQLIRRPRQA